MVGPEFVCLTCYRLMYKQNGVLYNQAYYTKVSDGMLRRVVCRNVTIKFLAWMETIGCVYKT